MNRDALGCQSNQGKKGDRAVVTGCCWQSSDGGWVLLSSFPGTDKGPNDQKDRKPIGGK